MSGANTQDYEAAGFKYQNIILYNKMYSVHGKLLGTVLVLLY